MEWVSTVSYAGGTHHRSSSVGGSLPRHDWENRSGSETVTGRLHCEMTRDLGRCAKSLNITVPVGTMTELPSQLSLE